MKNSYLIKLYIWNLKFTLQFNQASLKQAENKSFLLGNKINFTVANIAQARANLAKERSDLAKFSRENQQAIAAYQAIFQTTNPEQTTDIIEAKINLLNIYIRAQEWDLARNIVTENNLTPNNLPVNYRTLKTRLILAGSLTSLKEHHVSIAQSWDDISQQYLQLTQQAHNLGNYRLESSALGYLGQLIYEQQLNLDIDPQLLIERSLHLAQSNQAPEIAYRWQWQLGRIYRNKGDLTKALTAYEAAFASLQNLR